MVAVGIGLAASHASGLAIAPAWAGLTLIGAALLHAAVNVHNDYIDDLNGTDPNNRDRVFPFTGGSRMIQNGAMTRQETQRLAWVLYGITIVVGTSLLIRGGMPLLWLGLVGIILGWAYSAPPLALNRHGLGELTAALGFGMLMPVGADLVQRGMMHPLPAWAGLGFALIAANLLLINQFPDLRADRKAGKRHWVVRLGQARARYLYLAITAGAYLLPPALVATGRLPTATLLVWATLPLTLTAAALLWRHYKEPSRLRGALRTTVIATLAYGSLMILGLIVAG